MIDEPPLSEEPPLPPRRRGRRVPKGHEPNPEEIEQLLSWTYDLPALDRYNTLSDLEGLYWVACMRLHELRAMTVAELYDKNRYTYGQLALGFGVSRSWAQQMVRKGRLLLKGKKNVFVARSEPDDLTIQADTLLLPVTVLRARLLQAAQRKRQPMDAIAQAAIEAYLDALEAADDQGPGGAGSVDSDGDNGGTAAAG